MDKFFEQLGNYEGAYSPPVGGWEQLSLKLDKRVSSSSKFWSVFRIQLAMVVVLGFVLHTNDSCSYGDFRKKVKCPGNVDLKGVFNNNERSSDDKKLINEAQLTKSFEEEIGAKFTKLEKKYTVSSLPLLSLRSLDAKLVLRLQTNTINMLPITEAIKYKKKPLKHEVGAVSGLGKNGSYKLALSFYSSLKIANKWRLMAGISLNYLRPSPIVFEYKEVDLFLTRKERLISIRPTAIFYPELEIGGTYNWNDKWSSDVSVYFKYNALTNASISKERFANGVKEKEVSNAQIRGNLYTPFGIGMKIRQNVKCGKSARLFIEYQNGFLNQLNKVYFGDNHQFNRMLSFGICKEI